MSPDCRLGILTSGAPTIVPSRIPPFQWIIIPWLNWKNFRLKNGTMRDSTMPDSMGKSL
jgi:hypothetical protein